MNFGHHIAQDGRIHRITNIRQGIQQRHARFLQLLQMHKHLDQVTRLDATHKRQATAFADFLGPAIQQLQTNRLELLIQIDFVGRR